ncbi:MAG TPA: hypothetical protein VLO30_00130, partial [Chthoniobacterales bacterium]|nr:hypothetical protein [Chthoniobacterales bacterium]
MKTTVLVLGAVLFSTVAFAADQSAATQNPKLTEMLAAKDESGKSIVGPDEQAYFTGLNDNLKELLNRAVQKENITRPEHLAALLALQLRPQKMEILLQNNCILCHSDSANHSADTLFSPTSGTGGVP